MTPMSLYLNLAPLRTPTECERKVLTWLPYGYVAQLWFSFHSLHLQHLTSSTSPKEEQVESFFWAVTTPV